MPGRQTDRKGVENFLKYIRQGLSIREARRRVIEDGYGYISERQARNYARWNREFEKRSQEVLNDTRKGTTIRSDRKLPRRHLTKLPTFYEGKNINSTIYVAASRSYVFTDPNTGRQSRQRVTIRIPLTYRDIPFGYEIRNDVERILDNMVQAIYNKERGVGSDVESAVRLSSGASANVKLIGGHYG